jgi:hypothetical protein
MSDQRWVSRCKASVNYLTARERVEIVLEIEREGYSVDTDPVTFLAERKRQFESVSDDSNHFSCFLRAGHAGSHFAPWEDPKDRNVGGKSTWLRWDEEDEDRARTEVLDDCDSWDEIREVFAATPAGIEAAQRYDVRTSGNVTPEEEDAANEEEDAAFYEWSENLPFTSCEMFKGHEGPHRYDDSFWRIEGGGGR